MEVELWKLKFFKLGLLKLKLFKLKLFKLKFIKHVLPIVMFEELAFDVGFSEVEAFKVEVCQAEVWSS